MSNQTAFDVPAFVERMAAPAAACTDAAQDALAGFIDAMRLGYQLGLAAAEKKAS